MDFQLEIVLLLLMGVSHVNGIPFIRVCVCGPKLEKSCWKLSKELKRSGVLDVACVPASHPFECISLLQKSIADATLLSAEEVFVGGTSGVGLKPILQEVITGGGDPRFIDDAAVVIRKDLKLESGLKSLSSLKLCLAGASRNNIQYLAVTNVLLPLGYMKVANGDCDSAIPTISEHFGESCVPGPWSLDPELRDRNLRLCDLCRSVCTEQDFYAGFRGALRCLQDNDADLAVTSSRGVAETTLSPRHYDRLCIRGNREPLNGTCLWLGRRSATIVVRDSLSDASRAQLKAAIVAATEESERNETIHELMKGVFYLDGPSVQSIEDYMDTEVYLGRVFSRTMRTPFPPADCGTERLLRWCTYLRKDQIKCEHMSLALRSRRVKPNIVCRQARSEEECQRWVQGGLADISIFGTRRIFHSTHSDEPLAPVAMQVTKEKVSSEYLLAVTPISKNVTVPSVIGSLSCLTGLTDPLSWKIPLMRLEKLGLLQIKECDFTRAASSAFWQSCLPGVAALPEELFLHNLCGLCPLNCGTEGKFSGYKGAMECLGQAAGRDIAFMLVKKIDIALDSEKYQLLCPDDSRQPVTDFRDCNWFSVPLKMLAVAERRMGEDDRMKVAELLRTAQQIYGKSAEGEFSLFYAKGGEKGIFSDYAEAIRPVWPTEDWQSAIGEFTEVFDRLYACNGINGLPLHSLPLIFGIIIMYWLQ